MIEEFINTDDMPFQDTTKYPGVFSICPTCKMGHLELTSGNVEFTGPVWIEWW